MSRTKWMRLGVHDPADILRWAGAQNARQLDDFRHRMVHGREFVSFRMVPRYAIEIGTCDIVVVAHVKPGARQRLGAAMGALRRKAARRIAATFGALRPRQTAALSPGSAELYRLGAEPRLSSPSRV
jgi:hypothetical protein